jgi:hypothetical protein
VSMPETACFTMPVRPPRPERDAGIGMGMRVGVGVASPLRSEWPDYPEWEVPEREHKRADSIKLLLHDHASDTETTLGNHPFTRHGSCDFSANTCGSSSDQSHGHSLSHNYGHGHGYTTSIGASTISSPLANGFSVPAVPLRPPPRPRRPSVPAV